MQLYKMELYKLYHRKAFVIGSMTAFLILLLFFWFVQVGDEIATVDGVYYEGYEAVQKNRQITEMYKGILTDKKAADIVENYGFPQKIEQNYGGFRDANYLNDFVTTYLSDGYMYDWENYKIPTKAYPIVATDMGRIADMTGKPVELFYTTGWKVFLEVMQMGMILGSVLILFGVSVVFSDEKQTKMLPLILTTEEGKSKDIYAKMAAAFTLTIIIYGSVVITAFVLCSRVYGFDGAESPVGIVLSHINLKYSVMYLPVKYFAGIAMALCLLAALVLCAMTMCISAHFGNSFHSLAVSAVCWGAPVLIRMFFGGFAYLLIMGTPVFMIMTNIIWDIYLSWGVPVIFAMAVLILCAVNGYRFYKKDI